MENSLVLLQQDFKLFLQALWAELGLPSPTRAQYAIADYLQNGPKRLQVQAFRGVGKSWITGAFVLWTLFIIRLTNQLYDEFQFRPKQM